MLRELAVFSRAGLFGASGQALNFVAILLPVIAGRVHQVTALVFTSAAGGVACYFATWAFSSIFPRLRTELEAGVSALASLMALLLGSLLVVLTALVLSFVGKADAAVFFVWSGGLCLVQGIYLMGLTIRVRKSDYASIARARFEYGILNVGLTTLALFAEYQFSLVLVAIVVFGIIGVRLLREDLAYVYGLLRMGANSTGSEFRFYYRSHSHAAVSNLLGGLAFQAASFALPTIGVAQGAWGVVLRVSGGFASVGQQLVAPDSDMRVSRVIRGEDRGGTQPILHSALLVGLVLGLMAVGCTAAAGWLGGAFVDLPPSELALLAGCGVLYTLSLLSVCVVQNTLVLLGGERMRAVWATTKVACVIIAILVFHGLSLLIVLACLESVFSLAYGFLVLLKGRSRSAEMGDV